MSRLDKPSNGTPAPGSKLRSATYYGNQNPRLYGETCIVGDANVPGYSMVQFDAIRKLPVAWTHGWHMRPTAELQFSDKKKQRTPR